MNCNTTRSHPLYFYSRPCGRGDPAPASCGRRGSDFYSRPCGRGDPALRIPRDRLCISTHAPAGGATRSRPPAGRGGNYFYSRPCGRGDLIVTESNASKLIISTHAPAGGATRNGCAMLLVGAISTHAPAGGATWSGGSSFQKIRDFYSRPCGRGDGLEPAEKAADLHFYSRPCGRGDRLIADSAKRAFISTHAPAGGATDA